MNRERSQLLAFGHMLGVEMSNPRGEETPRLDEFHKLISQRQLYEQNLKDARALMIEYERKVQECRRIEEEQGDLIRKIQIAEDIELEEKQNIFKELDTYKMLSMCHICNTEPRNALDLPGMHFICCDECLDISKIWSGVPSCLMCRVRDHETDQHAEMQNSD